MKLCNVFSSFVYEFIYLCICKCFCREYASYFCFSLLHEVGSHLLPLVGIFVLMWVWIFSLMYVFYLIVISIVKSVIIKTKFSMKCNESILFGRINYFLYVTTSLQWRNMEFHQQLKFCSHPSIQICSFRHWIERNILSVFQKLIT